MHYWGKGINNLGSYSNVKNMKYKRQEQPAIGVFFLNVKKWAESLKNNKIHFTKNKTSISISQEFWPDPKKTFSPERF